MKIDIIDIKHYTIEKSFRLNKVAFQPIDFIIGEEIMIVDNQIKYLDGKKQVCVYHINDELFTQLFTKGYIKTIKFTN